MPQRSLRCGPFGGGRRRLQARFPRLSARRGPARRRPGTDLLPVEQLLGCKECCPFRLQGCLDQPLSPPGGRAAGGLRHRHRAPGRATAAARHFPLSAPTLPAPPTLPGPPPEHRLKARDRLSFTDLDSTAPPDRCPRNARPPSLPLPPYTPPPNR